MTSKNVLSVPCFAGSRINTRDAQKEPQTQIIAFQWHQEEEKTDNCIHYSYKTLQSNGKQGNQLSPSQGGYCSLQGNGTRQREVSLIFDGIKLDINVKGPSNQ